MKKIRRKSISFKFAIVFSLLLTALAFLMALSFSQLLWFSIREQKSSELENAANFIEKSISLQDDESIKNGFPTLPYYIDYIVYTTEHSTIDDNYEIISSNNPYLPHLSETLNGAKNYTEADYYIDGDLNIFYYAKKVKFADITFMIQTSENMDSDSSTRIITQLPKVIFIAIPPFFILCFLFSLMITNRTLKPVVKMTEKAKKISSTNLDTLLPVSSNDNEFDQLASTFNDLFSRLKKDFDRERQFTSDVSHELKTPVAVISGQSNLLRRWGKNDPEQLEKSLGIIISETKSMQNIISILLQMSRIECGKIQPEYNSMNITEMFERLKIETESINEKAGFKYQCPENKVITTDIELLHQVFTVIISNSLKFCNADSVVLEIKYYESDNKKIFELQDNGPGFSEEIIPHVFERFYRGDDAHSRAAGGSGLGLSIAQTIINSLNGKISAHNSPDHSGAMIRIVF